MYFVFSLFAVIVQLSAPPNLIAQETTSAYANMVLIPSGSFSMGGDAGLMDGGSQSHQTAYPIREVTVDAFWMASCSPRTMKNNGSDASRFEYNTLPQFDSIFTVDVTCFK